MNHWLPRTLLTVCALLVAGIAYEIVAPADPVSVPVQIGSVRAMRAVTLPVFTPSPEEEFAAVDARPVFNPSRQPISDQATGPAAGSPTDLSLVGVIQASENSIALLKSKTSSATMSARVGDMVNGWRVARIEPMRIVLRANGGEYQIQLDGPSSAAPSAPLPSSQMSVVPSAGQPLPAASVSPAPLAFRPAASIPAPPPPRPATLPVHSANGSIAPEALKGAPIDPTTGEPTL